MKIIAIEGTDGSGKATQSKLLAERLEKAGLKVRHFSFPVYQSSTGRVVGGAFLGKPEICQSFFDDASLVDPKVSSLYYAADRRYHNYAFKGDVDVLILDRYTYSNMAHQGSKMADKKSRRAFYDFVDKLEFDLLELPRPDKVVVLYVNPEISLGLIKQRNQLDHNEKNTEFIKKGAETYLELAELYDFDVIKCDQGDKMHSIESINDELYNLIANIV